MLLAVAGLDQDALEERTRLLASGEWQALSPYDRAAFFFAKKFSKTPWAIEGDDRDRLVAHFGRERALDVIGRASRCHFMARVADGFQLPLQRENVFAPPPSSPSPAEGPK